MASPSTTGKPAAARSGRGTGTRGPANATALLAAARRLAFERGENFTTQELVKEADVALQTFYRYFGSKDHLLLAVIAELIDEHCQALRVQAAELDDPVDRLRLCVANTLSTLVEGPGATGARFITSQHWRLYQLMPEALAQAMQPYADVVQEQLEAGAEAGVLAPRDAERDARLIMNLVVSAFHYQAFAEGDSGGAPASDDVWLFCLAAVGGHPTS